MRGQLRRTRDDLLLHVGDRELLDRLVVQPPPNMSTTATLQRWSYAFWQEVAAVHENRPLVTPLSAFAHVPLRAGHVQGGRPAQRHRRRQRDLYGEHDQPRRVRQLLTARTRALSRPAAW
jgi:hypothetical protein